MDVYRNYRKQNPDHNKVTGCLSLPNDLTNLRTIMIFLCSVAALRSWKGA